jgi:DNA repair protein RecN (Recombination protein N)
VYKEQNGAETQTHLRTLTNEERVLNLARMIGGDPPSKTAMSNAQELMAN